MALNVTTAVIGSGCNTATASPSLAQWDQGQALKIEGVDLPSAYQVEFSTEYTRNAIPRIGNADGVAIPKELLQRSAPITAYIVLHEGEDDRETEYWITIYITPRTPPETITPDPEQMDVIDETIAALQNGVADAEDAAESVQNMGVEAETLEPGSPLTVTKEVDPETGAVTLIFGLTQGPKGDDGYSPTITITTITGGHRFTVTDEAHPTGQSFDVMDGAKGDKGDDGYSPTITITTITGGHRFTVTDKNHPSGQSFDVMDGAKGDKGDDGYSPTITITTITGGHRVTITDKNHPSGQSFDVMDGVIQSVNGKSAASITLDAGDIEFDDSETYAAGSIGAEVSDAKNAIDELNNALNSINHGFDDGTIPHGTVTAGKYIRNSDGAEGSSSDFSATDYIFIGGLESVYIANPLAGNLNYNAFYDAGKNFISNFRVPATLVKLTVPSNAVYMRLSDITSRMQSFSVITPLVEEGNGCTIDIFNEGTIKIGSLKNGTYINRETGEESSSGDFACTNYLNINGLSKIVVYYQTALGQRYNFFYDEDLAGISGSSFTTNSGYNIIDVPSGACFVRLSEKQTNIATLKVFVPMLYKVNQLNDAITDISAEVSRIAPIVESGIGDETIINSLSEYSTHNGIVDYDNTWYQYGNSNFKHVAVPISGTRNIVRITAGTHATRIMGLTSYTAPTSSSHDMNIGQYWVRRIEINAGQSFEGLIPDDVNYLAINTLHNGENCVSSFELTSLDYEAGTTQKEYISNLYRVTASAQNVRDFSEGSGDGCPDNLVSTNLPLWKSFVSSWMNTDFLAMTEWFPYFDRSHTINAYEEIFKQFYPYKYEVPAVNPVRIILSKHKCLFMNLNDIVNVGFGLPMLVCNIAGQSVAVVCWLQSNADPASTRIQAYENAITALAQYDKVIVMGDFNTEQGLEELSTWTDAGYTLGNGGYWGEIKTWEDTTPNDNIVTRGFIYEYFEKGDKVTSDHSAVRARLSFNV